MAVRWRGSLCSQSAAACCSNLYEVFCNIRDDELEHVKTMTACEDNSIMTDLANLAKSKQRKLQELKGAA